jgi:hypothetical protein
VRLISFFTTSSTCSDTVSSLLGWKHTPYMRHCLGSGQLPSAFSPEVALAAFSAALHRPNTNSKSGMENCGNYLF